MLTATLRCATDWSKSHPRPSDQPTATQKPSGHRLQPSPKSTTTKLSVCSFFSSFFIFSECLLVFCSFFARFFELFFRFFKQLLGGRHLLSHCQNGIEIQVYCTIIACLLINLSSGRKPNKRTYEMICFYFCGLATEEEFLAHLAKLQRQDELASKKR